MKRYKPLRCCWCGRYIADKEFDKDGRAGWFTPPMGAAEIDPPDPEPVCPKCNKGRKLKIRRSHDTARNI